MVGEMTLVEGQKVSVERCAGPMLTGRGHEEVCMNIRQIVLCSLIVTLVLWSGLGWTQQPKPGGTMRLALAGDLTFFNANQGPAPGYFTFWVWNNIFNSLLTLTPPPELKIVPELATSWEVLDGGKTYIFRLEEGVQFHDGTAFDAQVAKWNFD